MSERKEWNSFFTDAIFTQAGLNRTVVKEIAKEDIQMGIEGLLHPLKIAHAVNDPHLKTGLLEIGTRNIHANIELFPMNRLLGVLELESGLLAATAPVPKSIVVESGRGRGRGRGRGAGRGTAMKRSHSSNTAFDDIISGSVDAEAEKRRKLAAMNTKAIPESALSLLDPGTCGSRTSIVSDFYPIINDIFQLYWKLKLDDPSVGAAFFAQINSSNCSQYGLENFAHESTSLTIIKKRLEGRAYSKADEFAYDFKVMLENILQYYPSDHPAVAKALEFKATFESQWNEARMALYGF